MLRLVARLGGCAGGDVGRCDAWCDAAGLPVGSRVDDETSRRIRELEESHVREIQNLKVCALAARMCRAHDTCARVAVCVSVCVRVERPGKVACCLLAICQ